MNVSKKPHARIPHTTYSTPDDLIEVYEDELAKIVTAHLKDELKAGEKVAFYCAGLYPKSGQGKQDKYYHFRVYHPGPRTV